MDHVKEEDRYLEIVAFSHFVAFCKITTWQIVAFVIAIWQIVARPQTRQK
jgi:hypothetical protein